MLCDEPLALCLRQTCEGEHADLVRDVVPFARCAFALEATAQQMPDLVDTIGHLLQLLLPLIKPFLISKHLHDKMRSVDWWARVHGPDHQLQLREHCFGMVCRVADHMQHAHALSIETQVLGKRLAQEELKSHVGEEADGGGVLLQVAAGVSLVCTVQEGNEAALLHDLCNLLPLLRTRINACWVVGASVKQHKGTLLHRCAQRVQHPMEIKAETILLPVWVGVSLKARLLEDREMVAPGGIGVPNLMRV
mmetsp:Transcript_28537/g.66126  ORF Transcript_28537/g.66126 Transcript_28537/m.66126 type:complete len:250 (+) Transcript_28537:160-909(+)